MITIKVDQALGITLANIPDAILAIGRNFNEERGIIMFEVTDEAASDTVRGAVERVVNHPVIYTNRPGYRLLTQGVAVRPGAQTMEREQQEEERACDECGEPIRNCECERCDECRELIDHCRCGPDFQNVETEGSLNRSLAARVEEVKLADEQIPIVIASKLENSTSNSAKILSDKLVQYNRAMGTLIALQNEINRLTQIVGADSIVGKITADMKKLQDADNIVEDIYLTNNYLVVKTKEIITDPLSDGKRHRIGKMQFLVDLAVLVGVTNYNRPPIYIRNMTRESKRNGIECGHVNLEGNPCFGTWTEPIIKVMKNYDIIQLVELLVRFVRQPNLNDCLGAPILRWPVIEERVEEVTHAA